MVARCAVLVVGSLLVLASPAFAQNQPPDKQPPGTPPGQRPPPPPSEPAPYNPPPPSTNPPPPNQPPNQPQQPQRQPYGAQPGQPPLVPEGMGPQRTPPPTQYVDAGRIVWGQSALPRGGRGVVSMFNFTAYTFDFVVNDNLELGLGTVIPVGIYGFMPRIKVMFHPSPIVHLGLAATGGVFGTFIGSEDKGTVLGIGAAGPILTLGTEHAFFNAAFYAGGAFGISNIDSSGWAMAANVGFSWHVSTSIRVHVEGWTPLHKDFPDNGRYWGVLYGIRIAGTHMTHDINFVIPIFPGFTDTFLKYFPIGIPMYTMSIMF